MLTSTNLQNSNLENAFLENADLRNANLRNANLTETNLSGANLSNANLRNANLTDADLDGTNLRGADLRNAYLHDANLRGANLRGANLEDADLSRANLRDADLRGTYLRRTILPRGDNMRGVNIQGINHAIIAAALRRAPRPAHIPQAPETILEETRAPVMAVQEEQQHIGAAYEIHKAFDKINVPDLITFFETKIENGSEIGVEFSRMTTPDFLNNIINANMSNFLSKFSPEELNSIPRKPTGYYPEDITSWEHIWRAIYNNRLIHFDFEDTEKKKLIGLSLYYASKQPYSFQISYALCYLDENAFAYSSAYKFMRNFSCSKRFVERFTTCLKAGIDTQLTAEVPEDKKLEYKMLKTKIQGGYDVDIAKLMIEEWQSDNKNIITENGEFRANKNELITQQRDHLIHYLCCELGVTQEELMRQKIISDTIEYMFSDDNVLDNTLEENEERKEKQEKFVKVEKQNENNIKENLLEKDKKRILSIYYPTNIDENFCVEKH